MRTDRHDEANGHFYKICLKIKDLPFNASQIKVPYNYGRSPPPIITA